MIRSRIHRFVRSLARSLAPHDASAVFAIPYVFCKLINQTKSNQIQGHNHRAFSHGSSSSATTATRRAAKICRRFVDW
jgi:hypothetical protein